MDLFASQKFTLISEIAGELPNGEALLKGLARGFFAASLPMETPEIANA